MTKKASLADYGLVGLVGGGGASLLVGMLTLGFSAFLGRLPVVLVGLLVITLLVTVVGLILTVTAGRSRDRSDA